MVTISNWDDVVNAGKVMDVQVINKTGNQIIIFGESTIELDYNASQVFGKLK